MKKTWETIKGYIWWTHSRGSFHYDVMVTFILLFIFVSPYFINYQDKPAEREPRPHSVVVMPNGNNGLIFRVDARDVTGPTDQEKDAELRRIIEPIANGVQIDRWAPEQDAKGNLVGYHVWVHR